MRSSLDDRRENFLIVYFIKIEQQEEGKQTNRGVEK